MSMAIRGAIDKGLEKIVSRKLLVWGVATGLAASGFLTSGDWVMIPPHKGPTIHYNVNIELGNSVDYQLYNLKEDPSQKNNLAESNTEKLQEMIESFKKIKS